MLRKRKREEINYTEVQTSTSSDDDIYYNNIETVGKWHVDIIRRMNIKVYNHEIFEFSNNNEDELYLEEIPDEMWSMYIDIGNLSVKNTIKTLVDEVKSIHDAQNMTEELSVDTYVSTLLHIMGFNDYPCAIKPQKKFEISVTKERIKIKAIPDFVIISKYFKALIIIEDKTMRNVSYADQWGENQVLGEMWIAAAEQAEETDVEIYAIRIIGTYFTFYKSIVPINYIKETLTKDIKEIITTSMCVMRYPEVGENVKRPHALDFCKFEDRKIIVEYMNKIKNQLMSP
jgi:hypothetical protein